MIENRTIFTGDNLDIMRGMVTESVDLIYLDPPFNSNHNYAAPIDSEAAGAAFKDTWTLYDIDETWQGLIAESYPALHSIIEAAGKINGDSDKSYLIYMAVRILEMYRLLKPTGSIYFHCDPVMSHSIKLMMDAIFDRSNFQREIIWRIGWVSGYKTKTKNWIRNHETIFFYTKNKANFVFNKEYIPYPDGYVRRDGKKPESEGIPIEDTWNCSANDELHSIQIMSFSKQKTGYPTQKSLALLERIIKASSNGGDVVLDPFCGCATTCLAAEKLGRQWIGIDISPLAAELIIKRLEKELGLFGLGINHRTDIPPPIEKRSKNIRHVLYHKQGGICVGCRESRPIQKLETDHIIPRSRGGSDSDSNLQLLCAWCNRTKGNRDMPYLVKRLKDEELMNE